MAPNFRFAVVSDLHIALPQTIWHHPNRFHLVEVSIPALESVLEHLSQLDLDFLLLPGDLTQHGEPENHAWLQERLSKLPFPSYVIPGNHDVPVMEADSQSIAFADFPKYYRKFGYGDGEKLYYTCPLLSGVQLVALNSNSFNDCGQQIGRVDSAQLQWLEETLASLGDQLVLLMVHHNIIEHIPNQTRHPMAHRYMLENAPQVLEIAQRYGVKLIFTGHLHVQDIACQDGIYDITTGSLVSYPHPYRVMEFRQDEYDRQWLQVLSHRVESTPEFPYLQKHSRQWMGDRSFPFLVKLLTLPPLSLPIQQAEQLAPSLREFWANIADGDALFREFDAPELLLEHFRSYGAIAPDGIPRLIDNHACLLL